MIILLFFLVLNFAISWFNAWSVGRSWAETRAAGGLARFFAWCGAIMSACGFTWCYLVALVLINQAIPTKYHLPDKYMEATFRLGYLMIILPIIGSGLAITVQSWMYFWRRRSFGNGAIAGWNTFADVYNIYQASKAIPESLDFLGALWDSDDDSPIYLKIVIVLAGLALLGGILTTTAIVRTTARNHSENMLDKIPSNS